MGEINMPPNTNNALLTAPLESSHLCFVHKKPTAIDTANAVITSMLFSYLGFFLFSHLLHIIIQSEILAVMEVLACIFGDDQSLQPEIRNYTQITGFAL